MTLKDLRCDKCEAIFHVQQLGTEIVKDDILRTWFPCPNCGEQYTVCYTNTGIRQLQEMHMKLLKHHRSKNMNKRIRDLYDRITVGMNRLREEIEG